MNVTSSEEIIVGQTLEEMDRRFPQLKNHSRLDDLLGTVIQFRPSSQYTFENTTETNSTQAMTDFEADAPPIEKIPLHTANLLHQIADATVENIRTLKTSELRSILHRLVALPFPVDDLVAAAEKEIDRRQSGSDENALALAKLQDALHQIPLDVLKQLGEISNSHQCKKVKKVLRWLVREQKGKHKDEEISADDMHASDDTQFTLEDVVEIIFAATEVKSSQVDFPTDQSDFVEYGRIQELISQYRRIDFESGARRSRFNQEGQRLMAKRMMSRLLP